MVVKIDVFDAEEGSVVSKSKGKQSMSCMCMKLHFNAHKHQKLRVCDAIYLQSGGDLPLIILSS